MQCWFDDLVYNHYRTTSQNHAYSPRTLALLPRVFYCYLMGFQKSCCEWLRFRSIWPKSLKTYSQCHHFRDFSVQIENSPCHRGDLNNNNNIEFPVFGGYKEILELNVTIFPCILLKEIQYYINIFEVMMKHITYLIFYFLCFSAAFIANISNWKKLTYRILHLNSSIIHIFYISTVYELKHLLFMFLLKVLLDKSWILPIICEWNGRNNSCFSLIKVFHRKLDAQIYITSFAYELEDMASILL